MTLSQPKRALFLDRDGVINVDHGYVCSWEQFEFMPGVVDALREISTFGVQLIVVTNQSGLARGMFSEAQMHVLHNQMMEALYDQKVDIRAIYWCPHHPEGSVQGLSLQCHCRKPAPGMIERAVRDHDIDLQQSILVGDKVTDIEAAICAGIPRRYLLGDRLSYGLANDERATVVRHWPILKELILEDLR